jgi:hypothetical protein
MTAGRRPPVTRTLYRRSAVARPCRRRNTVPDVLNTNHMADRATELGQLLLRGLRLRGTNGPVRSGMEIINLGEAEGLPPVDWAGVVAKLDAGSAPAADGANSRTTWLATVNEDGSPHVTAVGALWRDGTFWFQTGTGTRKGRNLARDRRCSVAISIRDADVVIEGDAARVTEPGALARIAKAWADNGWPAEPDQSGFGHHRPVQRTIARAAAVERVSHHATLGDRGLGGGAGRPDPLPSSRHDRTRYAAAPHRARPTATGQPARRRPTPTRQAAPTTRSGCGRWPGR